jgi:Fur family ferric uptake transcriptional regulator
VSSSSADHATAHITAPYIRAVLSQHDYRLTKPRERIIEQALLHDRPFTAEQLVAELRDETDARAAGIGRATVYRTLEILASVDVLSRVIQPNGAAAYVVDAPGHRHHLVCSSCGATISFTSCPVDTLVQHLTADTRYTIHDHVLEVFGTCPECQQRATA